MVRTLTVKLLVVCPPIWVMSGRLREDSAVLLMICSGSQCAACTQAEPSGPP